MASKNCSLLLSSFEVIEVNGGYTGAQIGGTLLGVKNNVFFVAPNRGLGKYLCGVWVKFNGSVLLIVRLAAKWQALSVNTRK